MKHTRELPLGEDVIMTTRELRPHACLAPLVAALAAPLSLSAAEAPEIAAVTDAMRGFVARQEVAGAVTLVAAPDRILHLSAVGQADVAAYRPARPDTIYWIASMTKPVTAVAILMLQDEGKLAVDDLVAKYLPELAGLKTRDGKPANLTLKDLLTHTSGMPEATPQELAAARTLADLIPAFASKPLQFLPRSKWQYCQSGINTLGRIVEVVSGQPLPEFFKARIFGPLGMQDTTFYPSAEQLSRIAKPYKREGGALAETAFWHGVDPAQHDHFPAANGGLYSTAADYARFCQMLLNRGTLDGMRYLKPETVALMSQVHSGDLKTGFTDGNGWGLGVCVVREPQGVTAALSPGSFGHGGAFGTQAWLDPARQRAYILMVQRADFPNSDASDVRRAFQDAAAGAPAP
jgi:CubicO group peptidase (beta-lactamase class C family)